MYITGRKNIGRRIVPNLIKEMEVEKKRSERGEAPKKMVEWCDDSDDEWRGPRSSLNFSKPIVISPQESQIQLTEKNKTTYLLDHIGAIYLFLNAKMAKKYQVSISVAGDPGQMQPKVFLQLSQWINFKRLFLNLEMVLCYSNGPWNTSRICSLSL